LGKDVHTPGVAPTEVYTTSHYLFDGGPETRPGLTDDKVARASGKLSVNTPLFKLTSHGTLYNSCYIGFHVTSPSLWTRDLLIWPSLSGVHDHRLKCLINQVSRRQAASVKAQSPWVSNRSRVLLLTTQPTFTSESMNPYLREILPLLNHRSTIYTWRTYSGFDRYVGILTVWRPVIMDTAIKHPAPDRVNCNFWHLGTLALRPERQCAQMSKITIDGLTRSGTGCFIAVPMWQQCASKG